MALEWMTADGLLHQADHEGRRAHVLVNSTGTAWWIDGGAWTHLGPHMLEEAKAEAEQALGAAASQVPVGLGGQLAEEVSAAAATEGVAVPPSPRDPRLGDAPTDPPFEATRDITQRQLERLEIDNHVMAREVMAGSVARERSPRQMLVQRMAEAAPREVQQQLRERADRAERFMASVRALAEAETVGPELVAELEREAAGDALAAAEAGVEVLRDLQRARMIAQATIDALQADINAARQRRAGLDTAIAQVHEHVLRPAAHAAGQGKTKRLDLATATIGIWKNSPAIALDEDFDVRVLPEDLQRIKIEPDKEAIKEAIAAGREVPGCSLVQTDRVEVR